MRCLAIDIGAESGRSIVGTISKGILRTWPVVRFSNEAIHLNDSLRWDLDALLANVRGCLKGLGSRLDSVGIDTWAVDFVLLDGLGRVLEQPYHYRDSRTDGMMEDVFEIIPRRDLYARTGIQFLPFNTIYQLYSMRYLAVLEQAVRFLTIPDYLIWALSGLDIHNSVCEFTNATTTQLLNWETRNWDVELLHRLGLPQSIFPAVVPPGTELGWLPGGAKLIAPACHDTGSAVAAVPAEVGDYAWLSSGTWSIMGVETSAPVVTDQSYALNFTNEGGVFGTNRLSKNVMGLWILQQCRETWKAQGTTYSYKQLASMAEEVTGDLPYFDPDDPIFLKPGDMCARVMQRTGLSQNDPGLIVRVVLESLARKYKVVLSELEQLVGHKLSRVHIIGGGSQNRLLNQLTANFCGVRVIAGPVEATAIGNLLIQFLALGEIGSLAEGRRIVATSFELERFEPK